MRITATHDQTIHGQRLGCSFSAGVYGPAPDSDSIHVTLYAASHNLPAARAVAELAQKRVGATGTLRLRTTQVGESEYGPCVNYVYGLA